MQVDISPSHARTSFWQRLGRGPAGILVGQGHLSGDTGVDPLLEAISAHRPAGSALASYDDLLDLGLAGANSVDLDWLAHAARSLPVPVHLSAVARYQWAGVWTSAIDPAVMRAFQSPWREVQQVFSADFVPPDPRNRKRLHCTYLFGSVNRSDVDERPPLTRLDFLRRRAMAQRLAMRIPGVIGPIGTLAIDSVVSADWLDAEILVPILAELTPGQAHIFKPPTSLSKNPALVELANYGLLTFHPEPLSVVLEAGIRAGALSVDPPSDEDDLKRIVSFGGRSVSVAKDIWIGLSSMAAILDESQLADQPPLSKDATYAAFRQFLGSGEGIPSWAGIARGFTFRRDFERDVVDRISALLADRDLPDEPILLHGATGTGKSIGLASIAFVLARTRTYPVIFVGGDADPSAQAQIDRFCGWAEEAGAEGSVVIWDGMFEPDAYERLARTFAGRGRRVALVGTAYRSSAQGARTQRVLAPGELSEPELSRLGDFLARFDESLRRLSGSDIAGDSTFLSYLYRLLPPTRSAMRQGVVKELEYVERKLVERAATQESASDLSPLAWALYQAGLVPKLELATPEGKEAAVSPVEDLAALIMIPAQFGIPVPLELLLRATGQYGIASVPHLLAEIDLVRWTEDPHGNFFLAGRSRLEAQLIVRSRIWSAADEIRIVRRLIVEVQDLDRSMSGPNEVDFVIDLVRSMGADGAPAARYTREFRNLAGALRELRLERGVVNPRIMLQEGHLLREWAIQVPGRSSEQRAERVAAVTEATSVLEAALEASPPMGSSPIANQIRVELASTLATQSHNLAPTDTPAVRKAFYDRALEQLSRARLAEQSSYYPVDVLAWSTRAAIRDNLLSEVEQADAIAEVLSAFEVLASVDLDPIQAERFHERRQGFATDVGNSALADEAFAALLQRGSGAGVYLRAKGIADPTLFQAPPSKTDVQAAKAALVYLDEYADLIRSDARCQNLRFDLWWVANAGQRPFADERFALPFSREKWRAALTHLMELDRAGTTYRELPLLFLRGLTEFHLEEYAQASSTFRELNRRSDEVSGRRRIVRSYVAADSNGEPTLYHGTVSSVYHDQRRGEVFVEEIRQHVVFRPREFRLESVHRGTDLGAFHLAFNFLGLVADPPLYLGRSRARS